MKKKLVVRAVLPILVFFAFLFVSFQDSDAQDLFNRQGGVAGAGIGAQSSERPQLFLNAPSSSTYRKSPNQRPGLLRKSSYKGQKEPSVWKQMNELSYQNKKEDIKQAVELQRENMKRVQQNQLRILAAQSQRKMANKEKHIRAQKEWHQKRAVEVPAPEKARNEVLLRGEGSLLGNSDKSEARKNNTSGQLFNTPY